MKLKAVIFDLDGTLVDTTEFVYQAYEYALLIHGLPAIDRKILSPLIGKSLEMIYREIAPQGDVAVLMEEHISFQKQNLSLVIQTQTCGRSETEPVDVVHPLSCVVGYRHEVSCPGPCNV